MTPRRFAVATEGLFLGPYGKTAHGVLRFRPETVAAVVDSTFAGRRVRDVAPAFGIDTPFVATLDEARALGATSLLVGVATDGGRIPPALRPVIVAAARAGLEVVNGLHELLADDTVVREAARRSGARLWDVRVPPADTPLFSGAAYGVEADVVLAVGSDCAVGKMTAMLEVERAARARNVRARFLATGQTGIVITGAGIPLDRVIADFAAGAVEELVLDAAAGADVLLVEGQGCIFHPAYAPVTFALVYGSAPDALLLCHRPNSTHIEGFATAIPPLRELVRRHEEVVGYVKPAHVAAIALDTSALDDAAARAALAIASEETGLPASDPVRDGGDVLWLALERTLRTTPKTRARGVPGDRRTG